MQVPQFIFSLFGFCLMSVAVMVEPAAGWLFYRLFCRGGSCLLGLCLLGLIVLAAVFPAAVAAGLFWGCLRGLLCLGSFFCRLRNRFFAMLKADGLQGNGLVQRLKPAALLAA